MSKIGLVIGREYFTRVKKKSFILMTFLGPLLMGGMIALAIYLSIDEPENQIVLVVDEAGINSNTNHLKSTEEIKYVMAGTNLDSAKAQLLNDNFTALLYIPRNIVEASAAKLHYKKYPSLMIQKKITFDLEEVIDNYKLVLFEIDPNLYRRIKTKVGLTTIDAEKNTEDKGKIAQSVVGFAFGILVYFFIFMYGVQIMRGVIEEKTNRIVEVIISSVKPFQLMMGKIIGIGLVGLTQFLLWVILTGAVYTFVLTVVFDDPMSGANVSQMQMTADLMQQEAEMQAMNQNMNEALEFLGRINFKVMIGTFLFYFLGGFLLYGSLFAAVGSAVDSETDTQQFILPITAPLIFAFIVAELSIQNPESTLIEVFSIIPFTSPIVMMIRIANGIEAGEIWQLVLSIALLIATFIGAVALSAKIYRTGILMYGKKVSWKELFKWLKY